MKEKNPYESQNTVDIPDFSTRKNEETAPEETVENTVNGQSVDMSVFELDADEYEEKEPVRKERKIRQSVIYAGAALLVALLILSIISMIVAGNARSSLKKLQADYDKLSENSKAVQKSYEDEITSLKAQIEELSKKSSGSDTPKPDDQSGAVRYRITASNGINIRAEASIESELVGSLANGDEVSVVGDLVPDNEGRQWGHTTDGHWVCLINGEEVYADKIG